MGDLTTLAAVKLYLDTTDNASDALLASLVSAYSGFVRSVTNRDFSLKSYSLIRDGAGSRQMWLPQWPIVSVEGVTVDGRAIAQQPSFGAYGYRVTPRAIVLDGACFTRGLANVTINYTAGYSVIPPDLAEAVCELVAFRYRLSDKMEWTSKTLAGETVALSTRDAPPGVMTLLSQYTNPVPL
jgi:hypothetical protein